MKKLLTAGMVFVLLVCLTYAYAGTAGTSSDPIISKNYIDSTYNSAVLVEGKKTIDDELQKVYDTAVAKLTGADTTTGEAVAAGYDYLTIPSGAAVTLTSGSSLILTGGSVKMTVTKGAVINISTASEVPSGSALTKNIRYFCVEDTEAVFTATADAVCAINGAYTAGTGVSAVFTHYTDVAATAWYYSAGVYAYNNKIFPDYSATTFRPSGAASRADTVYALWMAVGAPACSTKATYTDLTESWYMTAVSWAVVNGIINGAENNTFKPNDSLTREQLAVIMYRYTKYAGGSVSGSADLSAFTDAGKIASWSYTEMSWACSAGIITGTSKTEMSPQMTASRSQVATVLMRYVAA